MKSSPLRFSIPVAALLLAGCVAEDAGMRAYVGRHLDAWKGVDAERVVERFGAPDGEEALDDGGRLLVYRRRQPVLRLLDCEIDFRVGSRGTITDAQCVGPAEQCRMLLNPATRNAPSSPAHPVFVGLR
jgi:hypothetical protein